MNICILCSAGGHMTQAMSVMEAFKGHRVFLVTNRFPTVEGFAHPDIQKIYYLKFFGFSLFETMLTCLHNAILCIRIIIKEKPEIIFSTGFAITIPVFYFGKFILRCKLIYLESLTRVHTPSFNARAVYRICDLFLVQWESLLSCFKGRAKYAGWIL